MAAKRKPDPQMPRQFPHTTSAEGFMLIREP